MKPQFVRLEQVGQWFSDAGMDAVAATQGMFKDPVTQLERLGVPPHIVLLMQRAHSEGIEWTRGTLESLPYESLCRGLFLPLMMLDPVRVATLFGIRGSQRLASAERMNLAAEFLTRDSGLAITEKIGCLFCDPFFGVASRIRQDTLIRVLMGVRLVGRAALLDRLAQVRDVAVLYAESRCHHQRDTARLTSAEVLRAIHAVRDEPTNRKLRILRSLLVRMGSLEAFVFAKLLLGKHGPGLAVPMANVVQSLADRFEAPVGPVKHAVALTDIYRVARVLQDEGVEGLRAIRLQPLSPVRPALASGTTEHPIQFPTWVERKYDGVRMLLHKSTGRQGAVLCGAYTRNGNDWLELAVGLDATIRQVPAPSFILDCELYGMLPSIDGPRPATVYEVIGALRGERSPLSLRLAAFDILYLNGNDVTRQPLRQRQLIVSNLCAAVANRSLPVPLTMAEGQVAHSDEDVNRLYHHFRSQGYEGIITKSLDAAYTLGGRDPNWLKRKPEETLDVVLLGGTFSASQRHQGAFGSYVLGVLNDDGSGFDDIGDVDGVDREKDTRIQELILRDSLITGTRIERKLSEGSRMGVELRPGIVVTVVFQDVTREGDTFQLRHPRIKVIRSDKTPEEIDTSETIQEFYRAQQLQ